MGELTSFVRVGERTSFVRVGERNDVNDLTNRPTAVDNWPDQVGFRPSSGFEPYRKPIAPDLRALPLPLTLPLTIRLVTAYGIHGL